jgi:carbon storage regulator
MLVLSRKAGEQILIDEGITVSVMRVNGNRVQIGIKAPSSVRIRRVELEASAKQVPVAKSQIAVAG